MKSNYMREKITQAIFSLSLGEGALRERVKNACNDLLKANYSGTKAERTFKLITDKTQKVVQGDWSKVSESEIKEIAEHIVEMALNREQWIPLHAN